MTRVIESDDSDADVPLGAMKGAASTPAPNGNGAATNGNGKRARSASNTLDPASKPAVSHASIVRVLTTNSQPTCSYVIGVLHASLGV